MVRTNHFVARLIRFGQRGYGPENAAWNHCALYIGNGEIVEALTKGVVRSYASKYPPENVRIIRAKPRIMGGVDRDNVDFSMRYNARCFALSCIGEKYGFLTIAAIAVKVLTKGKIDFNIQGTSICSGLCGRALERMGYDWNPYDPAELTPAYLASVMS
jgi:uncharacterized protein YycO